MIDSKNFIVGTAVGGPSVGTGLGMVKGTSRKRGRDIIGVIAIVIAVLVVGGIILDGVL